ncbi:MAG: hypothetical protein J5507_02915 [Clostridia bacterium]|nr:hypothetical protein [Clostridia bacterium]
MKFINNKNAKYIFNASFIELIVLILSLLILKENIIKVIYIFRILYALEQVSYNTTRELIVMGANTNKSMSDFSANHYILESTATIITPIFSGFIIDTFSYSILLIILTIESIITILISTRLKSFYIDNSKMNLKEFINKAKGYKHLNDSYKCMLYRRISLKGAVTDLLPIILFLRVGTELNVGTYNSIFAILSIICLLLLKYRNRKNKEKKFYIPFAIIIFISSVVLVFNSNIVTFLIYYILMNSLGTILESESCSIIYKAIDIDDMSKYKREHNVIFCTYMLVGELISYGIAYILYNYFYTINILSISISIMMAFLIISCMYLSKVEKYFFSINSNF